MGKLLHLLYLTLTSAFDHLFSTRFMSTDENVPPHSGELSASEMDNLCHHFTEQLPDSGAIACSGHWVTGAHTKLRAVKNKVVTELMNSSDYRSALCTHKTFNISGNGSANETGSLVVAGLVNVSNVAINTTASPPDAQVHLKIPVNVDGIKNAVGVVPDMFKALLRRDAVWQGADKLRSVVYDAIFSSVPIPPLSKWTPSVDGKSISVRAESGLQFECSLLHADLSSNTGVRESDHTFSRRMMCSGVTRAYSAQPLVITAHCNTASSQMIRACVYPCSAKATGLLMATTHLSGFERPLRSCALVSPCTLRRHMSFGVHEADVSALLVPYARTHVRTLAEMFCKCAIMRTVQGSGAPVFKVSRLGDMDELELHMQYTTLRGKCTSMQLHTCASIWAGVQNSNGMTLDCISGTVDSFENDIYHTDVAMHTHNMMNISFNHGGQDFTTSSPVVVSLYGTYYHHT
jgi:hypothetical protein